MLKKFKILPFLCRKTAEQRYIVTWYQCPWSLIGLGICLFSLSGCALPELFSRPMKLAVTAVHQEPTSIPVNWEQSGGDPSALDLSQVGRISLHHGAINSLVLTRDGWGVLSGGDDGQIMLTQVPEAERGKNPKMNALQVQKIVEGTKPILAMSLSPNGRYLAVAQTSFVAILDLKTKTFVHTLTRIRGRVTALAWDPRGELVAIGMAGGDIYMWSLQETFFGGKGEDSLDSLERYTGGDSPIVSIIFHPSAGAFFSVEKEGALSLWRLLRTEEEMGLRDTFAVSDQITDVTNRITFGDAGGIVEEMILSPDGSALSVVGGGGKLSTWKVRGLVAQPKSDLGRDNLLSIVTVDPEPGMGRGELLLVAEQNQKVALLCRVLRPNEENLQGGFSSFKVANLGLSEPLPKPVSLLRALPSGAVIWGAEKTDRLVIILRSAVGVNHAVTSALCDGPPQK